jgi:hypothetical protein
MSTTQVAFLETSTRVQVRRIGDLYPWVPRQWNSMTQWKMTTPCQVDRGTIAHTIPGLATLLKA